MHDAWLGRATSPICLCHASKQGLHGAFCAGAANAGVPLAKIVQTYGWNAYFASLAGACGIVLLLLAPMTNLKSYSQRQAELEAKAA